MKFSRVRDDSRLIVKVRLLPFAKERTNYYHVARQLLRKEVLVIVTWHFAPLKRRL